MAKIYTSVSELVGNTPLLELRNIQKKYNLKAKILAKLECFNPAGSSKDRVAFSMIEEAEKSGVLKPSSVIIEPTSGNTGIGLSVAAISKGYKVIIVMPDTMSKERISLIKAYGAKVVLTDGTLGMQGAIDKAEAMAKELPDAFLAGQFTNPANPKAHFTSTGPEIFEDTDGELDFFVSAVGTGGTLTGVGSFLKKHKSDIKIVAVEPSNSAVLSGKQPSSHKIQGIGAGFIPKTLNVDIIDEIITSSDEDAYMLTNEIAKTEGILCGISSGAALFGALELAKRKENEGKTIVVLFPDTGTRYLSTNIFDE